jgi:hypothetical protein
LWALSEFEACHWFNPLKTRADCII